MLPHIGMSGPFIVHRLDERWQYIVHRNSEYQHVGLKKTKRNEIQHINIEEYLLLRCK